MAEAMLPLLILLLFIPQEKPPEKCALSGTVVNAVTGEPLGKVDLLLEPLDRQVTHIAVTRTDGEGRFSMVDLEPTRYHLKARRTGFLETNYGARHADADGAVLRLEAGQPVTGLVFKLEPSAVIAGTVRDGDGEPVEDAHVLLGRMVYKSGTPTLVADDSTDTDDRGEYRFRNLRAGKYYVRVEPKKQDWDQVDHSAGDAPKEVPVVTLYPGVADSSMASPVVVGTGKQLSGVDVRLVRSRVFRVSGRVIGAPAGKRLFLEMADVRNSGMADRQMHTSTRNSAGDFEFREVAPGSYEIDVGADSLRGMASVVVGTSDVQDVRVTLAPTATVEMRVSVEGDGKVDLMPVMSFYLSSGNRGFSPAPWSGNQLTAEGVPPGHYSLTVNKPRGFYVKSARTRDADLLADGLTVNGGGSIEVDVVFANDGGHVEGVVRDRNQQAVPGATVLLAPEQRSRRDRFLTITSDQTGRYEFAMTPPGNYKLFAWDDVEPGAWEDPEFLREIEKQGERVEVTAKGKTTADLATVVKEER